MIAISKRRLLVIVITIFSIGLCSSQDEKVLQDNESLYRKLSFFDLRGTSIADLAIGASLINGDYPEPEFELYFRVGFKQYITEYLNCK